MICIQCKKEKILNDLLGDTCYKCVFKNKLKLTNKKELTCEVCNNLIPKRRIKYCSEECMNISANEKKKNYWYRTINIVKITWRM